MTWRHCWLQGRKCVSSRIKAKRKQDFQQVLSDHSEAKTNWKSIYIQHGITRDSCVNHGLRSSCYCCPLGSKSFGAQGLLPDSLRSWKEIIFPWCPNASWGADHISQVSATVQKANVEFSCRNYLIAAQHMHKTSATSLMCRGKLKWLHLLTSVILFKRRMIYINYHCSHFWRWYKKASFEGFCLCLNW